MKTIKKTLSLVCLGLITLSSCSTYPPLQVGVWQNEESITFEDYGVTFNSIRIEIIENDDPNFVYDDFNAVRDDGGEYLTNSGLILYLYVDDVALCDFSLFGYTNGSWQGGLYIYDDVYTLRMRVRFNNDSKNKTTYFEAKFRLIYHGDNDPSSKYDGVWETSNPSTIYLYSI